MKLEVIFLAFTLCTGAAMAQTLRTQGEHVKHAVDALKVCADTRYQVYYEKNKTDPARDLAKAALQHCGVIRDTLLQSLEIANGIVLNKDNEARAEAYVRTVEAQIVNELSAKIMRQRSR